MIEIILWVIGLLVVVSLGVAAWIVVSCKIVADALDPANNDMDTES